MPNLQSTSSLFNTNNITTTGSKHKIMNEKPEPTIKEVIYLLSETIKRDPVYYMTLQDTIANAFCKQYNETKESDLIRINNSETDLKLTSIKAIANMAADRFLQSL